MARASLTDRLVAGVPLLLVVAIAGCAAAPSDAEPSRSSGPARATAADPSVAPRSSPSPTATATPTAGAPEADPPPIFVIVFENKEAEHILPGGAAPYIGSLATAYAYAADFHGVAYPSQPNYLAIWSGSTHGVAHNEPVDIDAPTIADQLDAEGLTWRVFAENVPVGCFTGPFSENGPDGAGIYTRKHNPAISFTAVSTDPARCANITDFSHFDPDAADLSLIIPNNCNSMHDCNIEVGDEWLRGFLPRITDSEAYRSGGIVVVTFDEDLGDGDNDIATVVVSEPARGLVSTQRYTHYSLLRTIQEHFRLPCLAESCAAEPMRDLVPSGG